MKSIYLFLMVLFTSAFFAQQPTKVDSLKTRMFNLSPMSSKVGRVNGLVLGAGHYDNTKIEMQHINGLNIEASPLAILVGTFGINILFEGVFVGLNDTTLKQSSFTKLEDSTVLKMNGLNVSSGGFMTGSEVNGINISVINLINKMNGFSANALILTSKNFNGVCISGIANVTDYGNGVQLAISNVSRNHKGVQIGLFNHSKNLRGLQFGLWNTNGKRRLPLLNWQFKK